MTLLKVRALVLLHSDKLFFPFLPVSLQSMRTHIIKKNAHPIYDELLEFSNLHPTKKHALLFTVLTYDTFTRDEILGQVEFAINLPNETATTTNTLGETETTFSKDIIPRHKQVRE